MAISDYLQQGGIDSYIANANQQAMANYQARNQANAQELMNTAQIVNDNMQKKRMASLLNGAISSDGTLNQGAYLQGLSQINPNEAISQYMKLGKNDSEVKKNLAAAAKDNQSAADIKHKLEMGKSGEMVKNIDNVMTMIKNSKSDDDKNRAIQYAESLNIPIPAYYKNTPFSQELVQQAQRDLLSAKDEVSANMSAQQQGFELYKQQYKEGQDILNNQRQNQSLDIQKGNLEARQDQNQANNFNRDNNAINKYQTVIDDANNEFRANASKAQAIMTAAKDSYNQIASIQAQTGNRGGSFEAAISSKVIPQGTWSTIQAGLERVGGLMFINSAQSMKGLGALSDADAARLVKSFGTFDVKMSFDYLKSILMDAYNSAQRGLQSGAEKLAQVRKTNLDTINKIKSGWQNNQDQGYSNAANAMGGNQMQAPVNTEEQPQVGQEMQQPPVDIPVANNFSPSNSLQNGSVPLPYGLPS